MSVELAHDLMKHLKPLVQELQRFWYDRSSFLIGLTLKVEIADMLQIYRKYGAVLLCFVRLSL